MAVIHKFVVALITFTFLASFFVTGSDYEDDDDINIKPSAKGQASPPPPPPPPPPAPKSPSPTSNSTPTSPLPANPSPMAPPQPSNSSTPMLDIMKPEICPVDPKWFVVTFLEDSRLIHDKLAMYVKPTCTNVPKFKTSINWDWYGTVSDVRVPQQKCIRFFSNRDCCGRHLDIRSNGPILYKQPKWNDVPKSFAFCNYAGGCPSNGGDDSSLAIFYEAYLLKAYDTLALEIQDCCTNIPATRTTKNGVWNSAISRFKLPPGKYLRAFDAPNCKGQHIDLPHGAKDNYIYSSGFNDRIKSFMPITKEMVVTLCQDQTADIPWYASAYVTGQEFTATAYGAQRNSKKSYGVFQLHVKPTCMVAPDTGISDVVVPNNNCVCLFDKPDCSGEAFPVATNNDYNFVIREGFNDRTRSYRACNQHITVRFVNETR